MEEDGDGIEGIEGEEKIIFRVGDIIKGRVVSLLNSTIHIVIDEKEFKYFILFVLIVGETLCV